MGDSFYNVALEFQVILIFALILAYFSNIILVNLFVLTLAPKSYNLLFEKIASLLKSQNSLFKTILVIIGLTILIFPTTFCFSSLLKTVFACNFLYLGFESVYVSCIDLNNNLKNNSVLKSQKFYAPIEKTLVSKIAKPFIQQYGKDTRVPYNEILLLDQNCRFKGKIDPSLADLKKFQPEYRMKFRELFILKNMSIINIDQIIDKSNRISVQMENARTISKDIVSFYERMKETPQLNFDIVNVTYAQISGVAENTMKNFPESTTVIGPKRLYEFISHQPIVDKYHAPTLGQKMSITEPKLQLNIQTDFLITEYLNDKYQLAPDNVQSNSNLIAKIAIKHPVQSSTILIDGYNFADKFAEKNNLEIVHRYLVSTSLTGGSNSKIDAQLANVLTDFVCVFKNTIDNKLVFVSVENKHYVGKIPDDITLTNFIKNTVTEKSLRLKKMETQLQTRTLNYQYVINVNYKDAQHWAIINPQNTVNPIVEQHTIKFDHVPTSKK
jgi:hypothetical protein